MTRDWQLSLERVRDDLHREMSASIRRAGVTFMSMTVVFDIEMRGLQFAHERVADARDAIRHGNTLRNGLTVTDS